MATRSLSQTRFLRRPRRIDLRAVLGIFLLLAATGGSIAFWTAANDTLAVLIATRDLPAGATLTPKDLAITQIRADDAIYQSALPARSLESLIGKQLAEPVHGHQLLVRAQVSNRPPLGTDQLAMTIPVKPETATGGLVRPGDAVQVLLTANPGKADSQTTVILPRVTVYDAGYEAGSTMVGTTGVSGTRGRVAEPGPLTWLTLLVTQDQSVRLAQAKWNGELDVVLLPPAE
jgi:Flp pilus assembly protein CpaB